MTSSSLYPMKYLSEFFVPYDSFLETNILLTSKSCILIVSYFCRNCFCGFFYPQNLCSSHSFLYLAEKKIVTKNFYNNLGYHVENTYLEMRLYK